MHTELQGRILRAVTTCTERLQRRPYRQSTARQLNKEELLDHGPQIIGTQLKQCLKQLTDPSIQHTPRAEDLEACRRLLSRFIEVSSVEPVPVRVPSQHLSFPALLEQRLRPAVHSGRSFRLAALGAILQLPKATAAGSIEAWDHCGFYTFLDLLSMAYPEPSPDRFERMITIARLLAYILSSLENASTLDDLLPLKGGLTALRAGAVPIAYIPRTKTLYIGNWYC
ncbi:hypothetical protein KBA73_02580 [Patescibacteria group bacterium]|nr:hypothetical protein [Patescibacteria group bacterium]